MKVSDYSDKLKHYANQVSNLQSDRHRLQKEITELKAQLAEARKDAERLVSMLPKRIPNGFVSFGKNYAEQEDKFNDPYNPMCKFKRIYLDECAAAIDAAKGGE